MALLTSLILAAFAGYIAAWYFGALTGNFALLLFVATVVTGVYWLAERFYFLPARRRAAQNLEASEAQRREELSRQGITQFDRQDSSARERILAQPWWLDWTAGLFPVILVVFLLRSFLAEPFRIPSGSMIPTLVTGDLILVNKFTYGLRLPVLNTKITEGKPLARGDVIVFRYPPQPSLDYIKRVVGLPGDEVSYLNKELRINGQAVPKTRVKDYFGDNAADGRVHMRYWPQFDEKLGDRTHRLLNYPDVRAGVSELDTMDFAGKDQCRYSVEGVTCKVPEGHYFVMGDNRDDSLDSRYWGFVPDANIVGRAFFIWMNFGSFGRIGSFD